MNEDDDRFNVGLNNIKQLKNTSSDYFQKNLFEKEKIKERVYSNKKLALGRKRDGSTYYLDIQEAFRMFICGKTRSGKTWLLRGIGDRMHRAGYSVVIPFDCKNELGFSSNPVQEKFRHLLLPDEKPKGYPIITFRPTFFKTLQGVGKELAPKNIYYSESFRQVEEIDFKTIMGYDELTINQQIGLEIIWDYFKKDKSLNLDNVDEIIESIEEFGNTQKIALQFKFRPIKKSFFFEEEHQIDLIHAIKNGLAVTFNMENFENFGREGGYPDVFVGMMLRKVINARRAKQIPPLLILLDEMGRFVPKERNPNCKVEITESYSLDTKYNIIYVSASQSFFDVPPEIINQSKYLMIPYNADIDEFKHALSSAGLIKNIQSLQNTAIRIKKGMRTHDWMIIDRNTSSYEIIQPLAPLSFHCETDKD
jgi:hypothetical protein